jgi:hypothetical protein
MQLAVYRSVTHLTYPDEALTYRYALHPIHAEELSRDGHLACWTDDSGTEPYVVIEIPDGSRITETEDGWQLQIPDQPYEIDAEDVYELATQCSLGLLVVRGPRPDARRHFWEPD